MYLNISNKLHLPFVEQGFVIDALTSLVPCPVLEWVQIILQQWGHFGGPRLCSIGTNRVELFFYFYFLFFTWCSIGNQPFSVGLVDQLFQPTRNPVKLVEDDGYRPLSQSWALTTNAILFNTVGVWCPLFPGIQPCFQLFNRKRLRLKRLFPIEHDLTGMNETLASVCLS